MQDVTSVCCGCVRDGVPMKLAEEPRSPRIALRADARAVIDRIQAGEVIPRLVSALVTSHSSDSESTATADEFDEEGNRRSTRRSERQDADRPPQPENDRQPRQESDRPARGERRSPSNGPRDSGSRTERRDAQPDVESEPIAAVESVAVESTSVESVVMPSEAVRDSAAVAAPPPEVAVSPTNQKATPIVASNDDQDDFAAGLDDDVALS